MYNVVDSIPEMNTEEIKKNLEDDGGLCPCCEKRITSNSMMASFTNDDGVFYYLICNKCVNMLNKVDDKLRNNKKILIEENLNLNISVYAALLLRNEPVISGENQEHMISVLNNNRAEWVIDDREFFKNNPDRRFRCRPIYFGELEETYIDKPHLKNDASIKGIRYALIHSVGYDQLVKSFVNDISDYPINEENFVAALFIVLIQKLDPSRVMDIYKDIGERKAIFKDIDSLKTYY